MKEKSRGKGRKEGRNEEERNNCMRGAASSAGEERKKKVDHQLGPQEVKGSVKGNKSIRSSAGPARPGSAHTQAWPTPRPGTPTFSPQFHQRLHSDLD